MDSARLLLVDLDPDYGKALARAVSNLQKEFEVTIITPDHWPVSGEFDLILIGSCHDEADKSLVLQFIKGKKSFDHNRLVILTDYKVEPLTEQYKHGDRSYWYIYKYGNVNDLISDLNYLTGILTGKQNFMRKSSAPVIIGFYSICGGAGKTVISIGTSRELSRYHGKRVLYLSFEEIPAAELFMRNNFENRNLGDYLYYLLEKKDPKAYSHPESFLTCDEFGVETFYPSTGRNDLNCLNREELISFLKVLSESSRYDYIALDLRSDLTEDTIYLLEKCSKIVLIDGDDPAAQWRAQKFVSFIRQNEDFGQEEKWIRVINRAIRSNLRDDAILIDEDPGSFRFVSDKLRVDINHVFGIGMKKIANEIISTKARKENV